MDKIIDVLSSLAPFLEQYPLWVKILFSAWIFLTAVLLLSFSFARISDEEERAGDEVWLIIERVQLFGDLNNSNSLVKVIAEVNGTDYTYPSLEGVEWMKVGPTMSSQQFRLPKTSSGYEVRFAAQLKLDDEITDFVSQETHVVKNLPLSKTFNLYRKEGSARAQNIEATVQYRFANSPE